MKRKTIQYKNNNLKEKTKYALSIGGTIIAIMLNSEIRAEEANLIGGELCKSYINVVGVGKICNEYKFLDCKESVMVEDKDSYHTHTVGMCDQGQCDGDIELSSSGKYAHTHKAYKSEWQNREGWGVWNHCVSNGSEISSVTEVLGHTHTGSGSGPCWQGSSYQTSGAYVKIPLCIEWSLSEEYLKFGLSKIDPNYIEIE